MRGAERPRLGRSGSLPVVGLRRRRTPGLFGGSGHIWGPSGLSWLWDHEDLRLCTSVCGDMRDPMAVPAVSGCGDVADLIAHSCLPLLIYVGFSQFKHLPWAANIPSMGSSDRQLRHLIEFLIS